MLIRVRHETTYRYGAPVKTAMQRLLLTPRNFEGQYVRRWRIEVDRDCRLVESEDAFGNICHRFSADGPLDALTTLVEGEVETFDTAGVVRGAPERFPPLLYTRETPLTAADAALRAFAQDIHARESTSLARLHRLNAEIFEQLTFDAEATDVATPAAEAFERRHGVCQDFAHVFIACARCLGAPARYVSGYFRRDDGVDEQAAGHAWAEAYVEDLGWIGFDPAHGLSPGEAYVRVAAALDYLGATPIRGARIGGGAEEMSVRVRVAEALDAQSQSQS
jgi:transglutaminase-like putative cysteine protease